MSPRIDWLAVLLLSAALGGCHKRSEQPAAGEGAALRTPTESAKPVASSQVEAATSAGDHRETGAREAVGRLKRALKQALQKALPGGFDAAVAACQLQAPEVAAAVSTGDITVGRATDRPRNPHNALAPWMKPLMERFRQPKAEAGTHETLTLPDGRLAYAEPIRVKPLCVMCHGQSLTEPVRAALAQRYPDDKAAGYAVGDLRGIFWAKVKGK